ncbi:oxamate carbamoyltransferase subunit AllH family protein, partial [Shigella sonnei]
PSAHSPEANMGWQKCSGIKRSYLSAITLEAALQQRCRENIHRFIHNIIYGVPGNSTQAIEKIKHIGSSSGCDMLYGMADGCALSQTYGGNYVS